LLDVKSMRSEEWYTPELYTNAVREVLDGIWLDPASCETANQVVKARKIYTREEDGLKQTWDANTIFLNPPYCRNQGLWVDKLIAERDNYNEAILLVSNATDTNWFQKLLQFPICFVKGRIKFWTTGEHKSRPTIGNAFVYLGDNQNKFADVFSKFGGVK
jgi:phage N-6-adenine-methyltransferase